MGRTVESRPRKSRLVRALVACCAIGYLALAASAQGKPSEDDVKAAYLFNFARFVRFAPGFQPHGSFDICILGRDSIGHTLDQITAGESIGGLPVRVVRLPDVTAGRNCAVLFLSADEQPNIREDLALLAGADVLTVGDMPDFVEHGGMIEFVTESNHVRFEVNLDAVSRTHLSLGSELLRVAVLVRGSQGGRR